MNTEAARPSPGVQVSVAEFEDIVGRHFRQPADGLSFDGSPAAHMWPHVIWPSSFL